MTKRRENCKARKRNHGSRNSLARQGQDHAGCSGYLGINSALKFTAVKYDEKMADDILDIALTMKKRVPLTIEQLAKKNPQFDRAYLEKALQALSEAAWSSSTGRTSTERTRTTPSAGCWICSFPAAPRS